MSRFAIRRSIGVTAAVLALTLSASSTAIARPTGPSNSTVDCTIKPASAKDSEPVPPQGPEPEPSTLQKLLSSLVENAGSTVGSDGAGWVMNLILGKSGNQSPTPGEQEILNELSAQKTQLDTLQASVNALANQLTNAQFAIQSQLTQSTYDALVGSASSNIAKIQSAVQEMCYLSAESRVYAPDGTDVARIQDIRQNAPQWLNELSDALLGINSQGIFEVYSEATWNALAPSATQQPNRAIYTSRYLASMKSLLAYYTSLAVQLFNVYSEAVHWQSDAHGAVPALDLDHTDKIAQFNAQLVTYLNSWSKAATLDIPSIAEGTVVDTRTAPMNIWTSTPATLAGVPSDRYCVSVVPLCLGNVWATDGKTQLTTRIVPSVAPIAGYVAAQFPGQHVPTTKEWTSLLGDTAHGANAAAGVANWATANAFSMLQSRSYATPTGPAQTVPPVVTADGQVLTFNETPYTQPTTRKGENATGYAGYLAVVSPQTTAEPYKPGIVQGTPADNDAAASRDAATPIATAAGGRTLTAPTAAPTPIVGTLGQPTAFSAVGCAAGAYQQPVGANAVKVSVRGASGGASKGEHGHNLAGGGGAVVSATIPLGAGGVLYPQVGGRGQASQPFQQPGGGGFGGGGTGGRAGGTTTSVPGTGGGGMSGISADAECSQWLVIAGGGGGAGALWAEDGGGEGGSGCITTGCAGHPVTTDGGGTAGTRSTGGTGGTSGNTKAGDGANGALYQGGAGGNAGAGANFGGSGGGGGGGGYGGGGGGGGGARQANGAGGGGGGSYLADGVSTASFQPGSTLNSGSVDASVTFEPVVAPEYSIGYFSTGNSPLDGVLTNADGATTTGNPILRQSANAATSQAWALLFPSAGATSFLLNNPASGQCAMPGPMAQSPVTLAPCFGPGSAASAPWALVSGVAQADYTGGYRLQAPSGLQAYSLDLSPRSFVIVVQPGPANATTEARLQWGLNLMASSIWTPLTAPNALAALSETQLGTPPIIRTEAPSTGLPAANEGASEQLAATGVGARTPLIAALVLIAAGSLIAFGSPGRRRGRR